MEQTLRPSQKLYLLGISPEKGGIASASYSAMDYVLLGSLFMELYQLKKIRFENKRIIVLERKSELELHRFILDKLSRAQSPLRISRWINKFYSSFKFIREEIQRELVEKRLIRMEPKRFLFFRWKKPVILNQKAVNDLLFEMQDLIFKGTKDETELIILSFILPCGLLNRIFPDSRKRKEAKKKLKTSLVDNPVSGAIRDAIAATQAIAASVAVSAAITAST